MVRPGTFCHCCAVADCGSTACPRSERRWNDFSKFGLVRLAKRCDVDGAVTGVAALPEGVGVSGLEKPAKAARLGLESSACRLRRTTGSGLTLATNCAPSEGRGLRACAVRTMRGGAAWELYDTCHVCVGARCHPACCAEAAWRTRGSLLEARFQKSEAEAEGVVDILGLRHFLPFMFCASSMWNIPATTRLPACMPMHAAAPTAWH